MGEISLRDFLDQRFQVLESELAEVKRLVTPHERRITELEFMVRILKWMGGVLMTIVIGLTLSALRGWLGL